MPVVSQSIFRTHYTTGCGVGPKSGASIGSLIVLAGA